MRPARDTVLQHRRGLSVPPDRMILELKYRQHVPAIFKRLVEEFALDAERASKYRLGMTALAGAGLRRRRP